MTDIFVGSVSVGVVPDARGWNDKLRAQLVPSAEKVGDEFGSTMSRKITDKMGEAGSKSGGAFDETFRKRVKAAMDALPRDADPAIAKLRERLKALYDSKIIDGDKAVEELLKVDAALERTRRDAKDITLSFDTKEARAQLALLRRDIGKEGAAGGGDRGFMSSLGILFGGGGGAVAAQGAGGAGQAGQAASAGGSLLSNPYVIVGAITAGLIALPFLAQAAAGAITFGLGGAIAGIGLLGAGMDKSFQDTTVKIKGHTVKIAGDFTKFKDQIKKDLMEIGQPLVPVLHNILNTAMQVMKTLTPLFRTVMGVIAGPLKIFVDTILKAFTLPAVQQSIKDVAKAFVAILNAFTPDIPGIATSLAQAISRMADAVAKNPKAFADFLNFLAQIVIAIIDAIAWLTVFVNYIEQHFGPAMHRIAVIFDGVRHEVAHIWDSMWNNTIAKTIQFGHDLAAWYNRIFRWIRNLFDGIRHDIAHYWDMIYENSIGRVIRLWQKTNTPFANMRHDISRHMDGIRHDVAHYWDVIWNNSVAKVIQGGHDVEAWYNRIKQWLTPYWQSLVGLSANAWDTIWNNTIGRAIRGWRDLMGVYTRLKNWIIGFFSGAETWLYDAGVNVIKGLFSGIASAMRGVGGWIKSNVVDPVVNAVKHFFGISSPSTVMMPIGRYVMQGVIHGMLTSGASLGHFVSMIFGGWPQALGSLVSKSLVDIAKLPAKALNALESVGGKVGGFFSSLWHKIAGGAGGVNQWAGVVMQALAMLHLPGSLMGQVLYQMQTESGGNPNAINNWDINAKMGDPSRGLLQVIGATFNAFHVPGTSGNIYDPLANVAAAINYAMHRYGPTLMSGGMGMGSGHGYDAGGWWPPGTFGWNMSGQHELVVTQDQLRSGALAGGASYHAHFDGLTGAAIESHVRSAFQAMSLTDGSLQRQGRRS